MVNHGMKNYLRRAMASISTSEFFAIFETSTQARAGGLFGK